MSRFLEEMLKSDLRRLLKVYVETFPFSYAVYNAGPADFMDDLHIYEGIITANGDDIRRAAAWGISGYSNLYRIMAKDGFDEFKSIYYLGRAVERHLLRANHVKMAQIHLFTMIGLLDEKLKHLGISKPLLTGAMTQLIKLSKFDSELGSTGCYLVYKCSSTVPKQYAGTSV